MRKRILTCLIFIAANFGYANAQQQRHFSNLLMPIAEFGSFGAQEDDLNTPLSVAVDQDQIIYIADHKNHRIQVRDKSGSLIRNIGKQGTGDGELKFPSSLSLVGNSILVADKGNGRIVVFSKDGGLVRNINIKSKDGSTVLPYYMAAKEEKIALIPFGDPTLYVFEQNGGIKEHILPREIDGLPLDPGGITFVGDDLLISDTASGRLVKLDTNGDVLQAAGEWGTHPGLLASPGGVTLTAKHVFVADQVNHRIQAFKLPDLKFDYQWGRHPVTGHEGSGRLHYPGTVAVTDNEALGVVCEPIEHRCQIFDLSNLESIPVQAVSETAWWEKRGRFHYGSRTKASAGLLIVTEQDTHAVLAFDITSDAPKLIKKFGGFGTEFGKFVMPSGPFYDSTRKLVSISDRGNNRVQQYSLIRSDGLPKAAALEQSTVIDLKSIFSKDIDFPKGYDPTRIDPGPQLMTSDGNMLVIDVAQGAFLYADRQFNILKPPVMLEKSSSGYHRKPVSAELSLDGKFVYFVDPWSYQVVKADLEGHQLLAWGKSGPGPEEFLFPFGITVDDDGSVYVSDTGKHVIKKFNSDGKFILEFGSYGVKEGQFYKPKGISFDADKKRLYVMDFGNHRAQVFDKDGKFILAFGVGEQYVPAMSTLVVKRPLVAFSQNISTPTAKDFGFFDLEKSPDDSTVTQKPLTVNIPSVDSYFSIELSLASSVFVTNSPYNIGMKVAENGRDITSQVQVRATATMPSHGHGLSEEIHIDKSSTITELQDLNFTMPGDWQLEIYVGKDGVWHRAFADFSVVEEK
ncbi:NHL repeat-containing protein [Azotobacter salinestris]|uniref:NHL repeat-containing protein n=1 Tax=Azotobacter salinestris TaxID=69964 RepID=UPI0032DED827